MTPNFKPVKPACKLTDSELEAKIKDLARYWQECEEAGMSRQADSVMTRINQLVSEQNRRKGG